MRLGTGQSGATLAICILRDGSPRPQADMWSRYVAKVRKQLLAPGYKPRRFLRHFASRAILYDFFIASGQDRARRFMGSVAFIRGHETDAVITMPAFVPKLVCTPYHFDISVTAKVIGSPAIAAASPAAHS